MNIVFLGSGQFAVAPLKILISSSHRISCVITQPDRQKGRGLHISGTPVKKVALEGKLALYQPKDINAPEAIEVLKNLKPDLLVVIAYGQLLSQGILDIPRIFAINLHASLLPKYRGAAPINWAIINGESVTGVTIIKMCQRMDAGSIILKREVNIDEADTALTLEEKLSDTGAHLLLESLKAIEEGSYKLNEQDETKVVFAPKLKKEDGLIKWDRPSHDIHNLIRGCIGWPGAFTYYKGRMLKIYRARVSSQVLKFANSNVGEIADISREGITVTTGKGALIIEELQIEGKRIMKAKNFVSGHKISVGDRLKINKNKKMLHHA